MGVGRPGSSGPARGADGRRRRAVRAARAIELEPSGRAGPRAGATADTSDAASSVASKRRSWSRIEPDRNRARSRMSPMSRCMRSALRSMVSSSERPLLVGRLRGRVEQQARARPDDGERRPQLVGDRREQVGPQPFEVLEDCGRVLGQAAVDDLLPEGREHVGPVVATGDANEAERRELREQVASDAIPEVGATIREAPGEIGERSRRARSGAGLPGSTGSPSATEGVTWRRIRRLSRATSPQGRALRPRRSS